MRSNHCQSCLTFFHKFLNFLQTFVGVSIIIYSVWMLNQWNKHAQIPQSSVLMVPEHDFLLNLAVNMVSSLEDGRVFCLKNLPSPWLYTLFWELESYYVQLLVLVTLQLKQSMDVACVFTLLTSILLILEAAFVGFITFDHQWVKDLPSDPTGELASIRAFIEENFDICKLVGITVIIIRALSLLVTIILRAMVSTRRGEDDNTDDDYSIIRGGTRPPLSNPHSSQTTGSSSTGGKIVHSDIWSTRMREKYGLNSGDVKYNSLDQTLSANSDTGSADRS